MLVTAKGKHGTNAYLEGRGNIPHSSLANYDRFTHLSPTYPSRWRLESEQTGGNRLG